MRSAAGTGQRAFDVLAQPAANTLHLPGDGGLVRAPQARDLRQRELLHVIERQQQTLARCERVLPPGDRLTQVIRESLTNVAGASGQPG